MSGDDPPATDGGHAREYSRVILVGVCAVAVLLATAVLPLLAPAGAGSPAESLVPLPGESQRPSGADTGLGTGGELGALDPGASTTVGGVDAEQSPFQSRDTDVHFRAQSTDAAYWRTGAYDTYTGSGWETDPTLAPYEGPITTGAGSEVRYAVTLERPSSALPTVWQPRTVSREGAMVTGMRALRTASRVPAGTTYQATSVRPPRDPDLLRTAGQDYPAGIEDRYTALPAGTRQRLGPFTDELTADSDSPYETARTVEQWLETEKRYSLNVSDEPDERVASQFVFEMEAGYCEYFATAMTAMLRSQDVPARYVVGYSTGERTGERTYTVRGMNAHAWVEVYFPETGWVRFDPTPGRERLQAEQAAMAAAGEDYQASETGSPGEQFTLGGPAPTATPERTGTPTPEPDPPDAGTDDQDPSDAGTDDPDTTDDGVSVRLNRSTTPGAAVLVTVTRDGDPVGNATVTFNGAVVGRTDAEGTVVGRVPYDARLDIGVTVPADRRPTAAVAPRSAEGPGDGRLFAVAAPRPQQTTNETFNVSTAATVTVSGETVTGVTVTVLARVDDVPVRNGTVTLDGRRVGTTDGAGRATVTLPTEPGNATVAVRRDAVAGNETLALAPLTVSTDPALPIALPGTDLTVTATLDGEPVAGATVVRDGRRVGETGLDGTATVTLPGAASADLTVSKYGQRERVAVTGLGRNLAAVVLATALCVGAAVVGVRRSGLTRATLRRWLDTAVQAAVGGLVALAALLDRTLARFPATLRALLSRELAVTGMFARVRTWLGRKRPGGPSAIAEREAGDATEGPTPQVTIRAAWRRFLTHVSLPRHWTHSPADIAAHAVAEDGLPPEAVRTLRDAFRAVEYGDRSADDRVAAVQAAIDAIEAAAEEREGEA